MDKRVSNKVLTLSVSYLPPKGGVAQIINTYSGMYPAFNHVATTVVGSRREKLVTFLMAIMKVIYYCLFRGVCIVHVHGSSHNSFWRKRIFINLAKILRKKVIYHVHGGEYKEFYQCNSDAVRLLFRKVDIVVALSNSWREFFEETLEHPRVRVVENVVALPTKSVTQGDALVHFLFFGELGQSKGVYDILDSLAENRDLLIDRVRLHIGGNGEVEEVLQRIWELELEGLVAFEGWVSGERKIQLLNLADVYILPSYNEGLPVSILEAMSYKLPVIATPVGGIPEIVVHNENGLLVDPGDSQAIGSAIRKMLADEDFRIRAGKVSYEKVQQYFPGPVSEKLEALYRELLD